MYARENCALSPHTKAVFFFYIQIVIAAIVEQEISLSPKAREFPTASYKILQVIINNGFNGRVKDIPIS